MKVISVLGQKGGSGKTTLTLSLAVAAHEANKSVAVVDLDPQASACKWGDRRDADPVIISVQPAGAPAKHANDRARKRGRPGAHRYARAAGTVRNRSGPGRGPDIDSVPSHD